MADDVVAILDEYLLLMGFLNRRFDEREKRGRQATKLKASGYQIEIRVWVPAGMRVSVDKVLGIDDDGIVHVLQVVGASVVKD